MGNRLDNRPARLVNQVRLTARFRILGILPLLFFSAHLFYYLHHGGVGYMLWMCNISNLVLAAGLLLGQVVLIRIAVLWLIPGLPLWFWYTALGGGWLLTSTLTHVGGLIVGFFALSKARISRWTWVYAFVWYLLMQQISRLVTPAEMNVNVAHRVYSGWENVFSAYWQFWLLSTLLVGVGLWMMEILLLKVWPPSAASLE